MHSVSGGCVATAANFACEFIQGTAATVNKRWRASWPHVATSPWWDGIGFLSRGYGLTMDHLRAVELVLADGQPYG